MLLKIYLLILQSHANMYPFWRCLWWPLPFSIYVSVSCIFVFVRVRVRVRGRVVVSVCLCFALSIFVSIVFVLVSVFVSFSSALSLFVVAFVALSLQGSLCFQNLEDMSVTQLNPNLNPNPIATNPLYCPCI